MSEEARAILIYEFEDTDALVGVYYEEDVKFTAIGETRDEVIDDVLFTLNELPRRTKQIADGDGELIDVMPLEVVEEDDE